jgi:hypothetical protein
VVLGAEDVEDGQDLTVIRDQRLANHVSRENQGLDDLEDLGGILDLLSLGFVLFSQEVLFRILKMTM